MSEDKNQKTECPTFDTNARDKFYWEIMEDIVNRRDYKVEDVVRQFPAYIMRRDMIKFLSHYELFKHVIDLPGNIVEFGVYRGFSLFTWGNLLETFCAFDRHRKVYGFDSFEGLTDFTEKDGVTKSGDVREDPSVLRYVGAFESTTAEAEDLVKIHNADSMFPNMDRTNLIVGDILETLPKFVEENPGLKISLLHFDVDLYEPTKLGLEMLYDKVVSGGVIVFDEYSLLAWPGETNAVDEFFAARGESPVIKKHPFTQTPSGYLIKK